MISSVVERFVHIEDVGSSNLSSPTILPSGKVVGHPTLFVLRHGETVWSRDRRVEGQSNSDLTEAGRGQAEEQGRILQILLQSTEDLDIYASPLWRAHETAKIALQDDFCLVSFDERLTEVGLGGWEGRLWSEIVSDDLSLRDPALSEFERCFLAPDGERFDAVRDRVRSFVDELLRPSVIIGHGVSGAILRGLVLGLDFKGMAALQQRQGAVLRLDDR